MCNRAEHGQDHGRENTLQSIPSSATPMHATSTQRNSRVLKSRISRKSAGLIRPTEKAITTAASVAWGMRPMSGASDAPVAINSGWGLGVVRPRR